MTSARPLLTTLARSGVALLAAAGILAPGTASGSGHSEAPQASPDPLLVESDWASSQWHHQMLGTRALHAAGHDGKGVRVAILDTAFALDTPEFSGRIREAFRVENGRVRVVPQGAPVRESHGTHVTGILAARDDQRGVVGIAPEVELILGDVLTSSGDPDDNVIAGLRHVAGRVDIVNLSLGGPIAHMPVSVRRSLCTAIAEARAGGTLVVVAAGNARTEGNPAISPASCPGALTVGAVGPDAVLAPFSSFDAAVDLVAPGVDILSTVPGHALPPPLAGQRHALNTLSGTSMAAPLVTGVAALVKSARPELSSEDLHRVLTNSALDLGARGVDSKYGAGLVDPGAALGLGATATAISWPTLGTGLRGPGAWTHAGRLHVRVEPPGTGEPVTEWALTWVADDGTVTSATLPGERVRLAMPVTSAYGTLLVEAHGGAQTRQIGPLPVAPLAEYEMPLANVRVTWTKQMRPQVHWSTHRPLWGERGESLYLMQWYEYVHPLNPPPVRTQDSLATTGGQRAGRQLVHLAAYGSARLERAWRWWYAGAQRGLPVMVCFDREGSLIGLAGCRKTYTTAVLPWQVHVERTGRAGAQATVTLNSLGWGLCSRRDQPRCAGETLTVQISGRTYTAVVNDLGSASFPVEIPTRGWIRADIRLGNPAETKGSTHVYGPVLGR